MTMQTGKNQKPIKKIYCPLCGSVMILKTTYKYRYPSGNPKKYFGCSNYPLCKCTHGANPDGTPLGKPADSLTKHYRIEAHNAFDPIWKDGYMTRDGAYIWLGHAMGYTGEVHIGDMNIRQCKLIIRICTIQMKSFKGEK